MSKNDEPTFRETEALRALYAAEVVYGQCEERAMKVAQANRDPWDDPKLQKLRIELHSHVLDAFRLQRPYIKQKLEDEYWDTTEHEPFVRNGEGEDPDGGLKLIDGWSFPVDVEYKRSAERHHGTVEQRVGKTKLLPFSTYRAAIDLLGETAEKLGILPETKTPPPADAVITMADIEGAPPEVAERILPESQKDKTEAD